jgi:uncharacterized protein
MISKSDHQSWYIRRLSPSWRLLLPALVLVVGFFLPARVGGFMDNQFIFFPERELIITPAGVGLPFREVFFPAEDGVLLHGWLVPGEPGKPLVLFFHGNAGNISHRVENLELLHRLGVSVFIVSYRGYGRSEGRASEEGTYRDARGALNWLRSDGWETSQMVYFGRSLGAAVAVQLALEAPPAGLILETPFTSIAAMGRHHNPILYLLLGWTLNARYDSLAKIEHIRAPLLIFQGDRDTIAPEEMARRLFAQANEPKTFFLIPGAGHNDTYVKGGARYWKEWERFLDELFPAGKK